MNLNFPIYTKPTKNYYGCCKCQDYHLEGDPMYDAHLYNQSKDGIKQMLVDQLEDWREQRANLEAERNKL